MRFDRPAMAPSSDDNVDPLPEGQIDLVNSAEVIKQSHPESGEGFVIKAARMVSSCEIASFVAHPGESLVPRKLRQVTQCHRDVGDVSKVGSGNSGVLECLHELCDFRVAGKTLCFQLRDCAGFLQKRPLKGKPIASLTFDLQTSRSASAPRRDTFCPK